VSLPARTLALAAALLAGAAPAFAQAPAPGRYDGELCVATGDAAPDCGPVEVRFARGGQVQLRISDIVYRLQLHSSQVDVMLMHGAMQIDGFTANYEWAGKALTFRDPDKPVSYRLQVGKR
jgi:hypothetical protein